MGVLEAKSRKRKRRADLKKIILGIISVAGILAVGAVAPNVLSAMGKLGLLPNKRQKEFIENSRSRLVQKGYLKYQDTFLVLTLKGERALRLLQLKEYRLKKPKHWDGKWRVLIFDIPEKQQHLRWQIRHTLQMIGFVRLQNSVWIYPYDCEDVITLLKTDFKAGRKVLYMVVDTLEFDKPYREHFGLLR